MNDWAGIDPGAANVSRDMGVVTPAPPAGGSAGRDGDDRVDDGQVRRLHPSGRMAIGSTDAGGRLLQRHGRVLVLGSSFFIVPVIVLEIVANWIAYDRFGAVSGAVVSVPEFVGGAEGRTGAESLFFYLSIVGQSLCVALVGGFAAIVAEEDRLGRGVTISRSLGTTLRRLPQLFAAWVLGHMWVFIAGLVLLNSRGAALVVATFFLSPVLVAFAALTVHVSPAVVLEGLGPFAAVRRSVRLTRLRWGGSIAFVLVSGITGLWIRFGVTFLPRLAEATGLVTFGAVGPLVEGAAGQIARLVSVPLVAAATAFCFSEARMQAEGYDLSIEARSAFDGENRAGPR